MIFATFGSASPFPRLLARLDQIAAALAEPVVVQTGSTPRTARNCVMFDYAPSLDAYFHEARLIVTHAGLGTQLELLKLGKPFLVVPRLARYGEHHDDHQLETCELLARKYHIRYLADVAELSVELLNREWRTAAYDPEPLARFRSGIGAVLAGGKKR